jgi:DNA-binding NarL/FixJ family response regulator
MEPGSKIAVMIASDHPIMRDGLRLRIQQEGDMHVICEAGDLAEILHCLRSRKPDVVVLDLHLPRGVGARATNSIRVISPTMPLVVLVNYPGEAPESRPGARVATAAVSKISANEQIIPAIRRVIAAARNPGAPSQP